MQLILGYNIFFYETGQNRVTGLFFEEKKLGRYLITISPILVGIYLLKVEREINYKFIIVFTFLIFVFLFVFLQLRESYVLLWFYNFRF